MRSRFDPHRLALLILSASLLAVTFSPPTLHAQSADYMVGPRDVLAVTVLNEPSLSGKFTVVADGTVTYPLLGAVKVGGLSLRAVERELTSKLADGFLEKPMVTVALDQVGSQQVLVIGEVKQAGSYPLTGRTTVLEALLKAGAPTQFAGPEVLVVRGAVPQDKPGNHGGSGGAESMSAAAAAAASAAAAPGSRVQRVNLDALQRGDLTQNIVLDAGDMVFVPRVEPNVPVYVTGHVKAPGAYPLSAGTSVLQALAQAGGATDRGSTGRITIVRKVNGKTVELKGRLHDLVQAGDTIIVGRRLF
jgi:polysaccharide export outer membrane protein